MARHSPPPVDENALVDDLYAGALDTDGWPRAFLAVAEYVGGHSFHACGWQRSRAVQTMALATDEYRTESLAAYYSHYNAIDHHLGYLQRARPGDLLLTQRLLGERFIANDAFHQEFLRRIGIGFRVGLCLLREGDFDYYLTLLRPSNTGGFESDQIARLERLVPHLVRSTAVFQRTNELRAHAELGHHALDQLGFAVIALDDSGRAKYANHAAEELLRGGLVLGTHDGRPRPIDATARQAFEAAFAAVRRDGRPVSLAWRTARHAGGTPSHVASLLRVEPGSTVWPFSDLPRVLLLIRQPEHSRRLDSNQLAQLFGLTRAEARVARSLMTGRPADEIAGLLGVRVSTVRSQIRSILQKTGCARQQDLIALLGGIPAVGH